MEEQDGTGNLSSTWSDNSSSFSSLYSTPASYSSFAERHPTASQSYRPKVDANTQQSIAYLRSLLDILYKSKIPGPKLIRLQRDFSTPLGHGGQGNVYGVSSSFTESALALQQQDVDAKAKHSAWFWTKCVVKHLRTDQRRNDVHHAYREISRLCHPSLQRHPHIVSLISWGISLDALESVSLDSLAMPLLILERAYCDLAQFIRSEDYDIASYEFLCDRCLEVGRGLAAVHSAGLIHGDLKLENILLFQKGGLSETIWIAKLCDFGSAVPISSDAREPSKYLGSDTWLPPECYERNLVGKPMPESLISCDIFVYGLVVWAVFIGIHFSPLYHMQSVDGNGASIVRNLGRQRFYAKASKSITASYVVASTGVHRLVADYTEQAFGHFGGGRELERMKKRQSRRAQGFGRFSSNDPSETTENKIRRVLMVLRGSLDDSPYRRDHQIWRYLNYKRFPVIPHVDDPDTFEPEHTSSCLTRDELLTCPHQTTSIPYLVPPGTSIAAVIKKTKQSLIHRFVQEALFLGRGLSQTSSIYLWSILRSLQYRISRPSARQRVYDNVSDILTKHYQEASLSKYLNHQEWEEHRDLSMCDFFQGHQYSDSIYAIARIYSLVKLCCWQQRELSNRARHKPTISAYLASENPEHGVLAWLCRGEIGRYELQEMIDESTLPWTFLFNSRLTVDEKGDILLVLFENGCNLADIVHHDGESATAFLWYLLQLDIDEQALRVAQHFQRIAEDETCLPERKYFLTGRVSVLSTSEDVNELGEGTTTALHEAVKAANYGLVIYLVEMRFDVKALDNSGKLALELAIGQPSSSSRNSIVALLTQNKGERMRDRHGRGMVFGHGAPLGWTEVRVSKSICAWQETSVEGDFDAITFIRPHTGLYDSDRITLGRIQGQGQVYRLDPMRFLKVSGGTGVLSEYKPASKPLFDDEWYEEDARIVAEPLPFQPLSDDRAWIRYPANGLYHAVTLFDMGISAVAQGEPASIKTFLIGFLLSDTFWTLELSFLHEGLKQKEWSLENITAVKTRIELGLLRTALTLVLIVVYITPGGLANVLFLSCAVSVIGLLLWIDFMFFRHTHYLLSDPDEMWSSGHRQLINESRTMARRPFPDIIRAAICLVLLGFCTDSLIRSLTRQPPLIRYFLALFVVPLVTRVSMQYWFVRRERLHSTDSLMNHTLEAMHKSTDDSIYLIGGDDDLIHSGYLYYELSAQEWEIDVFK
ncbi:hypothetical protein Q9189_001168 [Teloschistes chrysophthalmus]